MGGGRGEEGDWGSIGGGWKGYHVTLLDQVEKEH